MKQRLSAHLIRPGDLNPGWVLLYAVTWALQYFCAACRFLLIDGILALLDLITGWGWPVNIPSVVIGFGPLGISLATLVLPLGGWWFQQQLGGRHPRGASKRSSRPPSSSCGPKTRSCGRRGAGSSARIPNPTLAPTPTP